MRVRWFDCPRCNGEGEIFTGYDEEGNRIEMTPDEYRKDEPEYMYPDICPDCDGMGRVTEEYFNFMGI